MSGCQWNWSHGAGLLDWRKLWRGLWFHTKSRNDSLLRTVSYPWMDWTGWQVKSTNCLSTAQINLVRQFFPPSFPATGSQIQIDSSWGTFIGDEIYCRLPGHFVIASSGFKLSPQLNDMEVEPSIADLHFSLCFSEFLMVLMIKTWSHHVKPCQIRPLLNPQ